MKLFSIHSYIFPSQTECKVFDACAEGWVKDLSNPNVSHSYVCEVLVKALVGAIRGHVFPQLHIHAVKLTQVPKVKHKKIGVYPSNIECAVES